jgi:predicted RNA binding protein YcfA (HicA-like mRNA interferase family)
MEFNSRKLLRLLQADGRQIARTRGDHVTLKHPSIAALITVPHPKKDLPKGLVRSIYKTAGWKT